MSTNKHILKKETIKEKDYLKTYFQIYFEL